MGAHPRSRGEHFEWDVARLGDEGSSPLARGTLDAVVEFLTLQGLIPARAGNTASCIGVEVWNRAHPRSRGEHNSVAMMTVEEMGSSPLARGTHLLTWGFTPYISKIESLWSQSLHPEYTINNCS